MSINILQELSELKIKTEFSGDRNVKVLCPFHDDKDASLSIELESGQFNCFSCPAHGHFVQYIAKLKTDITGTPVSTQEVAEYYVKKYNLNSDKASIKPQVIDEYADRIFNAMPLVQELHKRGVTDEAIKEHKLGENNGRITIPIFNRNGDCINIQKYLPGATTRKFINANMETVSSR